MPRSHDVVVEIGDIAVLLRTTDPSLVRILEKRFHRFVNPSATPDFEFEIAVVDRGVSDPDADIRVHANHDLWTIVRGDFRAEWNITTRRGRIRQTANPFAIDSLLRIVHTLVLACDRHGGFLLHASSAIRDGRAYVFTGPSGAGKSTIVGLAPGGVTVLTDEISYLRRVGDRFIAFGTPFAGERSDLGEPASAPVAALFRLGRGHVNEQERLDTTRTVQTLMRNILFFADDRALVDRVLDSACEFAAQVPAYELRFVPDARVWSTIP
jgi:hypothetical protein